MGKINEQLDALFMAWKPEKNIEHFVKDGLMLKSKDRNIDVDAEWLKLSRRILFLLKDQPQKENERCCQDSRTWTEDENNSGLYGTLFSRIANLFYGLSQITTDKDRQVWYGELDDIKVRNHFNTIPFGFMECKKEPGDTTIDNKELTMVMERDKNFINAEIDIINPNIIVCCGAPQYGFMINKYGKENLHEYGYGNKNQKNLQYYPDKNIVILYVEHPSVVAKDNEYYDISMNNFREFLKSEDGKKFLGE